MGGLKFDTIMIFITAEILSLITLAAAHNLPTIEANEAIRQVIKSMFGLLAANHIT